MSLLTLLLFVGALLGFFVLMRRARCLGWLVGLACLIGFLYLVGVVR